jgi:4-hydroxy-4-methyl-2-oxoglutarate aldolase
MSERPSFETSESIAEAYGVSTMYEAAGRTGLIDLELIAIVPEAKVAGRARTVLCGQDDNLMVPAAIAHVRRGEVLVVRMPESRPVSMLGGLLAEQCVARGVAGVLVDAAVRDVAEIRALGLPVWARYVRARSAGKKIVGALDAPLEIGGTTIATGDLIVMDADGAVVVAAARVDEALAAAAARVAQENVKLERYRRGELSYDLDGLRPLVERP